MKSSGWLLGVVVLAGCASSPTNPTGVSDVSGVRYQVKSGDTVSQIAEQYRINWRTLSQVNQLDDKHTIYAGQWLVIPPSVETSVQMPQAVPAQPISVQSPQPQPQSQPQPNPVLVSTALHNTAPKPTVTVVSQSPTPNLAPNPTPNPTPQVVLDEDRFIYPMNNHQIAKGFGLPIQGGATQGVFFVGKAGEQIVASQAGTVVYADTKSKRPMVMIEHSNGYVSTYFDVANISVTNNDSVEQGQILGVMSPQTKSGQGLFEFRLSRFGRYIDPAVQFTD